MTLKQTYVYGEGENTMHWLWREEVMRHLFENRVGRRDLSEDLFLVLQYQFARDTSMLLSQQLQVMTETSSYVYQQHLVRALPHTVAQPLFQGVEARVHLRILSCPVSTHIVVDTDFIFRVLGKPDEER